MDNEEKLKQLYNKVRKNPSKVDEVIKEALIIEKELKVVKSNRIMSFVSLKNDLILQKKLTERGIDSYLDDLKYCIENKVYLSKDSNEESPFKIFEMIAKIQYAYNLLRINKSIKDIYEDFLEEFNKNFDYYFRYFRDREITYDHYQLTFIYSIYFLFINNLSKNEIRNLNIKKLDMKNIIKNKTYKYLIFSIIYRLKEYKIDYYKLGPIRKNKELRNFKYDFIYKE